MVSSYVMTPPMKHLLNLLKVSSVRTIPKPISGSPCFDRNILQGGYRAMKVPIVVLACKSDLEHQVEPERALEVLQQYDVGLVEVAKAEEHGKEKMRRTFGWLLKAVFRDRSSSAYTTRGFPY